MLPPDLRSSIFWISVTRMSRKWRAVSLVQAIDFQLRSLFRVGQTPISSEDRVVKFAAIGLHEFAGNVSFAARSSKPLS